MVDEKHNVLIVDDDATHRELLAGRFRSAGYLVTEAREGAEALEAARSGPVDVVVSDIQMPRVGGLDLLERLGDQYPVILMSGGMTPATRERAISGGAAAVFSKPIDWPELLEAVEEASRECPPIPSALVLEGRPATRIFLERLLRREGYQVDSTSDSREALERATQASRPYTIFVADLLRLDPNAPSVRSTLETIRAQTKIVLTAGAMTAAADGGSVAQGQATVWTKPFDLEGLITDLRNLKRGVADGEDPEVLSWWSRALRRHERRKTAIRGLGLLMVLGFAVALLVSRVG
ncbi:MAG: response regulator [Planctomycetota bacterium]|nr:response regulator [Planctomycetota bacterium]